MKLLSVFEIRKELGVDSPTLRRYLDVYAKYLPEGVKLGKNTKYPTSISKTLQDINLWFKSGLSHKEIDEKLSVGEGESNALPQQLGKDKFTVLSEDIRELTNVVRELHYAIITTSQQQIQHQINNKLNALLSHITTTTTQLHSNQIELKPESPIVAESHEKVEPGPIQSEESAHLTIEQDQAPDTSDKPEIGSTEHRKQIYYFIHTCHKQGQGDMNLNEIMNALNEAGIEARAGGTWNSVGAISSAYLQLKREFWSPGKSLKQPTKSADTRPTGIPVVKPAAGKSLKIPAPKPADTTTQKKDPVPPEINENELDLFTGEPIPKPTLPDCHGKELTVAERDKYLFRVEEIFPGKGKTQQRAEALNTAGILTGRGKKWTAKLVADNLRFAKIRAEK